MNLQNLESNTLWQRWNHFAESQPEKEAIVHWQAANENHIWTYGELLEFANRFSAHIKQLGVKKGDVCAIIIRHNPMFYPLYLGIVGVGALPAVMAYPNPRLHHKKFRNGLIGMAERSGLDFIFTELELEKFIRPLIVNRNKINSGLFFPLEWDLKDGVEQNKLHELKQFRDSINANDSALVQHSSGTTGLQKPIELSHCAILNHANNYGRSIELANTDKIVSWLPLYHDMGLIAAFHLPLAAGLTTVQIDPFEWVLMPSILLNAISEERATLTWLPNFAFNLMADKVRDEELENISLMNLRMIINCSEKVRASSHEKFYKRFINYDLHQNTLTSMYAMAETTLSITQSLPGRRSKELLIEKSALARGLVEPTDNRFKASICVSSGQVIDGCEVKIVNDRRENIDGNRIGEIAVKSVSMFEGYKNYPEKTLEVTDSKGWFYTGDLGFIFENELYVIGRIKDIMIIGGENIYPEDVEDILNNIDDVIPGRAVAFSDENEALGTEQICVVAETKLDNDIQLIKLSKDIVEAGIKIDVTISKVYLVPPRWLIKSSSGKPSRKTNKERILDNIDKNVWSIQ